MNFSLVRVMLALQNHAKTDSETDRPQNKIKAQLVVNSTSHLNRKLEKEEEQSKKSFFEIEKNKKLAERRRKSVECVVVVFCEPYIEYY